MDPNETLRQIQRIVASSDDVLHGLYSHKNAEQDFAVLCELVQALDEWLSKGGFLPTQWTKARSE